MNEKHKTAIPLQTEDLDNVVGGSFDASREDEAIKLLYKCVMDGCQTGKKMMDTMSRKGWGKTFGTNPVCVKCPRLIGFWN